MLKRLRDRILGPQPSGPSLPAFEIVPAANVYSAFAEVARLEALGFAELSQGFFARQVSEDVVQLIKLKALKALQYAPWWGVSLTYLPVVKGEKLQWHRTLKSAQFDVYDEPLDFFKLRPRHNVPGTFSANIAHGVAYMRESMQEMWSTVRQPIDTWLSSASDLKGVAQRAEEQLVRGWMGPIHQPHPLLVLAFTSARLGRRADAAEGLTAYFDVAELQPGQERLLRSALESAV